MPKATHITFIVNQKKAGSLELAKSLEAQAKQFGISSTIITDFPVPAESLANSQLAITIGGDGTLLSLVNSIPGIPVLGVNLGRLGFMTHFSPEDITESLESILNGDFRTSRRSLLTVSDNSKNSFKCLNDVVIKATGSKLVRLRVTCDGEEMNTYHADGIIISTPTGSTAYNLSAGGPIVHPEAKVLIVTPINPHTLSHRAIVLNESHTLEISAIETTSEILISGDGLHEFSSPIQFPITVKVKPNDQFSIVEKSNCTHHYVLRSKLRWSGDSFNSSAS